MFISSPSTTVGKTAPEHPEYQSNPITPNDSTDIALGPDGGTCRGILVTGPGNINVNLLGGGTAVLTGVVAGQRVVVGVTRVLSTSTTATGLSALY